MSDFFIDDNYTFFTYDNKGGNNGFVINHLSEQLINQFKKRLVDKDYIIDLQKTTINTLNDIIKNQNK